MPVKAIGLPISRKSKFNFSHYQSLCRNEARFSTGYAKLKLLLVLNAVSPGKSLQPFQADRPLTRSAPAKTAILNSFQSMLRGQTNENRNPQGVCVIQNQTAENSVNDVGYRS
ncbi:MAG: hypothetical protein ABSA78_17320 [Candidatus Sulfotelmatobacter sp.]|jgi:hypothetical protein